MHNVEHRIEGDKLIITVGIGKAALDAAPPSGSGKTNLVGSTSGALPIPGPKGIALSYSLNVMAKKVA